MTIEMIAQSPAPLQRVTYARIPDVLAMPNMIEMQVNSFQWFQEKGLRALLDEISPIQSFNKDMELYVPGL